MSKTVSAPGRVVDKQEAIRHLLHAAVRLIIKREDPFAIHLLIQSADKLLNDLATKRGQTLRVDWKLYVKDEYRSAFFKRHRSIYNYFKHADKDFADNLPVPDIMMLNVMTLFVCIANYATLFRQHTAHMNFFLYFFSNLSPGIIAPLAAAKVKRLKGTMTPGRYFQTFETNTKILPKLTAEVSTDLQDIKDFYNLTFSRLRAHRKR
jgi:hypothetical protein